MDTSSSDETADERDLARARNKVLRKPQILGRLKNRFEQNQGFLRLWGRASGTSFIGRKRDSRTSPLSSSERKYSPPNQSQLWGEPQTLLPQSAPARLSFTLTPRTPRSKISASPRESLPSAEPTTQNGVYFSSEATGVFGISSALSPRFLTVNGDRKALDRDHFSSPVGHLETQEKLETTYTRLQKEFCKTNAAAQVLSFHSVGTPIQHHDESKHSNGWKVKQSDTVTTASGKDTGCGEDNGAISPQEWREALAAVKAASNALKAEQSEVATSSLKARASEDSGIIDAINVTHKELRTLAKDFQVFKAKMTEDNDVLATAIVNQREELRALTQMVAGMVMSPPLVSLPRPPAGAEAGGGALPGGTASSASTHNATPSTAAGGAPAGTAAAAESAAPATPAPEAR